MRNSVQDQLNGLVLPFDSTKLIMSSRRAWLWRDPIPLQHSEEDCVVEFGIKADRDWTSMLMYPHQLHDAGSSFHVSILDGLRFREHCSHAHCMQAGYRTREGSLPVEEINANKRVKLAVDVRKGHLAERERLPRADADIAFLT